MCALNRLLTSYYKKLDDATCKGGVPIQQTTCIYETIPYTYKPNNTLAKLPYKDNTLEIRHTLIGRSYNKLMHIRLKRQFDIYHV